ncbi:MAG: arginine--tRNA ligase [Candidatus Woesearchaeota archaeon]
MDFKHKIAQLIHAETKIPLSDIESLIEIPPDSKLGDYAFPCFILAKQLKKSPMNIALELQESLTVINIKEDHKHFELIKNEGAYLNFFINKELFSKTIIKKILHEQESYGQKEKTGKIVLIESPGPNTNKPLHLGHLRNMLLGQSLRNILKKNGHEVYIVNVVNDRGIHICKSMLAYQKLSNGETPESTRIKSDHFVGNYYVKYSELEKANPKISEDAQEMLQKWENGDEDTLALWKRMNEWALNGFNETYKKLDFEIEKEYFESDTYKHGRDIIEEGVKKGLFKKDETGTIFDLEHINLGKKVLLRSDGTSVYITQDIYMAKKRYEDFKFDSMYYVVGNEQNHHFKVLFEIFKALGWKFSNNCHHFSYGMVELPDGKMKSREGSVIDTDELIHDVTLIAKQELIQRYPDLETDELNERAKIITLSAIRFFFLKYDPLRNFVFNPKESLSFDGETGPYVEYSNARINSIFKKLDSKIDLVKDFEKIDLTLLKTDSEYSIIRQLSDYPMILEKSALEMKPALICRYLIDLSQKFNEFYHSSPVLNTDVQLRDARLALISAVQIVLKSAMGLLSIVPVEEM